MKKRGRKLLGEKLFSSCVFIESSFSRILYNNNDYNMFDGNENCDGNIMRIMRKNGKGNIRVATQKENRENWEKVGTNLNREKTAMNILLQENLYILGFALFVRLNF